MSHVRTLFVTLWTLAFGGILIVARAAVPILRYLPNSWIIGKQQADHLDKASGAG